MKDFIQKNTWNLLITAIATVIAFTTLSARVDVIAQDHDEINIRLSKIEDLTQRLIILEERTSQDKEDIQEIKQDIKDIKGYFNLK